MNVHQIDFITFLNSLAKIPEDQSQKLLSITVEKQLKKGETFTRAGEKPTSIAFVSKGFFRYYYLDEKGHEYTKGFFAPYTFLSAYTALIQQRESYFTIEALEDSTIQIIQFKDWLALMTDQLCWHQVLLAFLQRGFTIKETREREFLLSNAETRYLNFQTAFPGYEDRIKQHHIASYLGISPVSLSRIRKKLESINIG